MKKTILWDFDGVIIDSMAVREEGFRRVLDDFPPAQVHQLIEFHRLNGGLSRYVKLRHFFEDIVGRPTSEEEVRERAASFSTLMRETLTDPRYLIEDAVAFLRAGHQRYHFHVVSGSDQAELRALCAALGIDLYFGEVLGSPTPKIENVRDLLERHGLDRAQVCLIGDSGNDLDAARANGIAFVGYNNPALEPRADRYLHSLGALDGELTW